MLSIKKNVFNKQILQVILVKWKIYLFFLKIWIRGYHNCILLSGLALASFPFFREMFKSVSNNSTKYNVDCPNEQQMNANNRINHQNPVAGWYLAVNISSSSLSIYRYPVSVRRLVFMSNHLQIGRLDVSVTKLQ